MATASITSQLQFDYFGYPNRGFEDLEQAFLDEETQMDSDSSGYSIVEKNKLVGTLLSLYNTTESHHHPQQQQQANCIQGYISTNQAVRSNQQQESDFGQYMEYVDSPPDSKEAWPADYLKSAMQVSNNKMVGVEGDARNGSGPNSPANIELTKKRRMNWDEIQVGNQVSGGNAAGQQQVNQAMVKDQLHMERRKLARYSGNSGQQHDGDSGTGDNEGQASSVVVPQSGNNAAPAQQVNSGNGSNANQNSGAGAAATGTGGGAWGDIDFDLNNELSSNGYMNDTLFYHSLGAFKQEVPSPTQDKNSILKQGGTGNAGQQLIGKRSHVLMSGDVTANSNNNNGPAVDDLQAHHNMSAGSPETAANRSTADIINSLQPHQQQQQQQQQMCHIPQQAINTAANNGGGNGNGSGGGGGNGNVHSDNVVNFQQMLQESNYNDKLNGNAGVNCRVMTPPQVDRPLITSVYSIDDVRFQYVLAAATSIATKNNEDTLTYLNQGQSYEIKLKKLGDLTNYRNKVLKSVIKICFYERRLQYMEREQMQQWQANRPGERILEIDVPLSFGCQPSQSASQLNCVEVMWDPMKEVGVYIKVNCISTEFTPKKHGGEKGVPFRIQVETFLENRPVHGAMCQIKVFKLKGADRKHKQDREKIQKRPVSEQEKFQPSYECTILNDLPMELLQNQTDSANAAGMSPSEHVPAIMHSPPTTANAKFEATGLQFAYTSNSNSSSSNSLGVLNRTGSTSNPNLCKTLELIPSPPAALQAKDYYDMQNIQVSKDTTPQHLTQWINYHRLSSHMSTFAHFSGSDLLRLTKDDLIQICGLADGIRMYNILHKKAITPRLTIFVSFDGACFHALYLYTNKLRELKEKTQNLPGFWQTYAKKQPKSEGQNNGNGFMWEMQQGGKINEEPVDSDFDMLLHLPSGIHVMMTEDVISHMKDESSYLLVVENRHVTLRPIVKE